MFQLLLIIIYFALIGKKKKKAIDIGIGKCYYIKSATYSDEVRSPTISRVSTLTLRRRLAGVQNFDFPGSIEC